MRTRVRRRATRRPPRARARAPTGPTWPAGGAPAPRVSACDRAPGRHRRRGRQGGKCTCVRARWDRRLTDVLCATRLARRPRPRGCAHARRPSVAHHCVGSVGSHGGGRHGVCRQGRVRARCRREGSSVDCRRARTPFVVQEGSHKLEERARAHRAHERVARSACAARAWSPRPPSTLPILAGARAARVCAPPDARRVLPPPLVRARLCCYRIGDAPTTEPTLTRADPPPRLIAAPTRARA